MKIVSLVSRQAMANVLPVLQLKPEFVFLLSTSEELKTAIHIKNILESHSINSIIEIISAYDYNITSEAVKKIILSNSDSDIILNVTGGTKIMALAAFEVFRIFNKQVIYCDTGSKVIKFITPASHEVDIDAVLTTQDYLFSYGYKILSSLSNEDTAYYSVFFNWLLTNTQLFIKATDLFRSKVKQNEPRGSISFKGIQLIKNYDIYQIIASNFQKKPLNVSSKFLVGEWLELFAYYVITTKSRIPCLLGSMISSSEGITNELDLIFIKDYSLNIISCKSGKTGNTDLYELEVLRNIAGGTFAKAVFLSAHPLSYSETKRANELNISPKTIIEFINEF